MSINLENTKKNKKETDPQEIRYRRRKDAIKNFAIVFLVIMLVLTFFSNTIMNYSLPQVAVQYMESGTITTTIRGTGTVESGDPYNVMVNESRTVSSITCRVGQEVRQGDLLFSLSGEDSDELVAAMDALEAAQKAYDDELLSDAVTAAIMASASTNISIDQYRSQITTAQNAQNEAQLNVDKQQEVVNNLEYQLAATQSSYSPSTAYNNAKAKLDKAYSDYNTALTEKNKLDEANSAVSDALDVWNDAIKTRDDLSTEIANKEPDVNAAKADYDTKNDDPSIDASVKEDARVLYTTLKAEYDALVTQKNEAEEAITTAQTSYNDVLAANATILANEASINSDYNSKKTAYEQAKIELEQIEANQGAGTVANSDTVNSLNAQLTTAKNELSRLTTILDEKKQAVNNLVTDISLIRTLNALSDAVVEAQKKVDKLTTSTAAKDVTSPINGTILSVYIVSGKKTDPSNACVVIQPEGQSFTMSFTVTNDEAKTISIGANATVANSWWYNDVTGYVESIRPDTASPNTSKLVTLNLSGSLTSGQSLTMTIDSRTSNYDCIVPNSAIHEDNNGKFILVVESKSSPLGNRYFAVRYDVQVLASDDTKSAVKAGLEGFEYVVTTSSKPISAGDQVRLSEN